MSEQLNALNACKAACERVINQYDGVIAGIDWHALLGSIDRALSTHHAAPEAPQQEASEDEPPPNSLPNWSECALRVKNSEFIAKRVAEGGYGADPDSKLANELHRFIYEYDDADRYRSAWFLHRLEKLITFVQEEARAAATALTIKDSSIVATAPAGGVMDFQAIDDLGPLREGWRVVVEDGRNGLGVYAYYKDKHDAEDCAFIASVAALTTAAREAEPAGGVTLTCRHSNRSDCALFGMDDAPATTRPSREWYAKMIAETEGMDDMLPMGALASPVTDEMVNRFLAWKLPEDFYPDCGVSFKPLGHPNGWPIGTNLLTAQQARAMLEHVLGPALTTAARAAEPNPYNACESFKSYTLAVKQKAVAERRVEELEDVLASVAEQFRLHGNNLPDGFDARTFRWVADALAGKKSAQAAEPEGWKLVPSVVHDLVLSGDLEPMLQRAEEETIRLGLYRARQQMQAAASPTPPTGTSKEGGE